MKFQELKKQLLSLRARDKIRLARLLLLSARNDVRAEPNDTWMGQHAACLIEQTIGLVRMVQQRLAGNRKF